MANSPKIDGSGLVSLSILCNGTQLDGTHKIISVTVNKKINQIPRAKIILLDGDMAKGDFPASNAADFKPGSEIEIKAGYDQQSETIFKGIVIRHGIRIASENQAQLIVDCRDKAVKMTIGRKNANYVNKKDSEIIASLIQDRKSVV